MIKNSSILALTIGTALSLGGMVVTAAQAADAAKEKCYGVVKAGKNDCAGSTHACSGQAKSDGDAKEFVTLPSGTCERLVNGRVG